MVLLAVYSMMAHVGALSGDAFPGAENGAQVLTRVVSALFGAPDIRTAAQELFDLTLRVFP